MKNYFEEFYNRYEELKSDLEKKVGDLSSDKNLMKAISGYHQLLNNIVMAGLGMGTLYLRMGAVLMIAEKTNKSADENDISFLKVIAEKLIHKLPADGDWLEIWKKFLEKDKQCKWYEIISKSTQPKIHDAFVSLRNDIAHQKIIISETSELSEIQKALKTLDAMTSFRTQFQQSIISTENNEVYFQYSSNEDKLKISPYVQINKDKTKEEIGVLPYLFQGRYFKGSKFINTEGNETEEEKDDSLDETFDSIKREIARFNGDKSFNFAEKINNYNEWCIGREEEVNSILKWINNAETDKNVLPIFAPAGLGKGALVAEVIKNLKEKNIKHLFHFCGSGPANNLQAILYSLIIQGIEKNYWDSQSLPEKFKNKLERLPSQYTDVIELFQALMLSENETSENEISKALKNPNPDGRFNAIYNVLKKIIKKNDKYQLDELLNQFYLTAKQLIDSRGDKLPLDYYRYIFDIHFSLTKYGLKSDFLDLIPENHQKPSKKYLEPLVIIIDGLDEAAVADHSKRISDWFYTFDDKGERKEKWASPEHIKWILTYRQTAKDNKEGFQFDYHEFNTHELSEVQPLKGLTEEAVKNGIAESFKKHEPSLSKEFIDTIIKKGAVK
jgi:hypothetical protein